MENHDLAKVKVIIAGNVFRVSLPGCRYVDLVTSFGQGEGNKTSQHDGKTINFQNIRD